MHAGPRHIKVMGGTEKLHPVDRSHMHQPSSPPGHSPSDIRHKPSPTPGRLAKCTVASRHSSEAFTHLSQEIMRGSCGYCRERCCGACGSNLLLPLPLACCLVLFASCSPTFLEFEGGTPASWLDRIQKIEFLI